MMALPSEPVEVLLDVLRNVLGSGRREGAVKMESAVEKPPRRVGEFRGV